MDFNFNETSIITGYIKELLREFNLPVYSVLKDTNKHISKLYVNNNKIVQYLADGTTKDICDYIYNKKDANYTKNLIINSSIYDSYTHTYLGDYLRFIRDYKGINLMPLYNCFNTERPVGLNYSLQLDNCIYTVNTNDSKYNYYIIPAKFDEKYTIKINAAVPYELSCIIYTGDQVLDISKEVSKLTYKKVIETGKRYSYVYSTKVADVNLPEFAKNYWQYEENLRILLKLPKSVTSAITILEGDYTAYDKICGKSFTSKMILDDGLYDELGKSLSIEKLSYKVADGVSKLSLLDNNGSISRPFASRLVEYLLGNTIDNLTNIPNNVANVQEAIINNLYYNNEESTPKFIGYHDIWDDKFIKINVLRKLAYPKASLNTKKAFYNILSYDKSTRGYTKANDDYALLRPIDECYDLLGYIDKDTEQNLDIKTIVG